MIQVVVAVFDSAAQVFGRPIFTVSNGVAVRSFVDEVNRADSDMSKHPEDFELHQLATFDDTAGTFSPQVSLLMRAKDVSMKG